MLSLCQQKPGHTIGVGTAPTGVMNRTPRPLRLPGSWNNAPIQLGNNQVRKQARLLLFWGENGHWFLKGKIKIIIIWWKPLLGGCVDTHHWPVEAGDVIYRGIQCISARAGLDPTSKTERADVLFWCTHYLQYIRLAGERDMEDVCGGVDRESSSQINY